MPVALVQSTVVLGPDTFGDTTISVTFSSVTTAGNLVVAMGGGENNGTDPTPAFKVTDSKSNTWTLVANRQNQGDGGLTVWVSTLATGGSTHQITLSSSNVLMSLGLAIAEFSGVGDLLSTAASSGNSTLMNSGTITMGSSGVLGLGAGFFYSGTTEWVSVDNWTTLQSTMIDGHDLLTQYQIAASSGSTAASFRKTAATAQAWACIGAVFDSSVAPGGGDDEPYGAQALAMGIGR